MFIVANNLAHETAEDVLSEVLKSIVPLIIAKYLPLENYE